MGTDNYVYRLVYYRRREEMTNDRFATLVVRIGEYGEQTPLRDISAPADTFQLMLSVPEQAFVSRGNGSIFMLSHSISITSGNVGGTLPTLHAVSFEHSSIRTPSKATKGHVFVNLTFQVQAQTVSTGSANDFLAERMRIAQSQIQFGRVSEMELDPSTTGSVSSDFSIIAYGDKTEPVFDDTYEQRVENYFQVKQAIAKKQRGETFSDSSVLRTNC